MKKIFAAVCLCSALLLVTPAHAQQVIAYQTLSPVVSSFDSLTNTPVSSYRREPNCDICAARRTLLWGRRNHASGCLLFASDNHVLTSHHLFAGRDIYARDGLLSGHDLHASHGLFAGRHVHSGNDLFTGCHVYAGDGLFARDDLLAHRGGGLLAGCLLWPVATYTYRVAPAYVPGEPVRNFFRALAY